MRNVRQALLLVASLAAGACGGEGASTTSGGAGGSGGQGSGGQGAGDPVIACTTVDTCPGTDGDCQERACIAGACTMKYRADGAKIAAQTAGDCKVVVCDGKGASAIVDDPSDTLDDGNACTIDACDANGPSHTPAKLGKGCSQDGGKLCDGAGKCVECLDASNCQSQVCDQNKCVPASCDDTVKNGKETDVDCGGLCAPCDNGKKCFVPKDCASGICTNDLCVAPACEDGVKNGGETDVDCGGGCPKGCGVGKGCGVDADCTGGACSGAVCLPTCSDGTKNGSETDVDCGGACPTKCGDGKVCGAASDCASGVCKSGVCKAPSCGDGIIGQGEDCDDGNTLAGDGCGPGCQFEPGWLCAGSPSGCVPICGDGKVIAPEGCDDGNAQAGDGCNGLCKVEAGFNCAGVPSVCTAICGDGIKVGAEGCDDGNATAGDGCASCKVEAGYACSGMPSKCAPLCGDGKILAPEVCDDGNTAAGDGCSPSCAVENGFSCSGTPSVCSPVQIVKAGPGLNLALNDDGYNGALNAPSMTCVTLNVPMAAPNVIKKVTVTLGMDHAALGDLVVKLVSPGNQVITLLNRAGYAEPDDTGTGGPGDNTDLAAAAPISFTDGAATSAEQMGATLTTAFTACLHDMICSYDPFAGAAPAGKLAALAGQPANGAWKVCVGDSELGDVGKIDSVTLTILK